MAVSPLNARTTSSQFDLQPFQRRYAALIASWARDELEGYWLAPRTAPPLTAAKVAAWAGFQREPVQLVPRGGRLPVAYGELNVLNAWRREYWLGHLVVDPAQRGRGLGLRLVSGLLARGFSQRGAHRISLVVFRENERAIRCYRAAGMIDDGEELHRFPLYDREETLLRMVARPRL